MCHTDETETLLPPIFDEVIVDDYLARQGLMGR